MVNGHCDLIDEIFDTTFCFPQKLTWLKAHISLLLYIVYPHHCLVGCNAMDGWLLYSVWLAGWIISSRTKCTVILYSTVVDNTIHSWLVLGFVVFYWLDWGGGGWCAEVSKFVNISLLRRSLAPCLADCWTTTEEVVQRFWSCLAFFVGEMQVTCHSSQWTQESVR